MQSLQEVRTSRHKSLPKKRVTRRMSIWDRKHKREQTKHTGIPTKRKCNTAGRQRDQVQNWNQRTGRRRI